MLPYAINYGQPVNRAAPLNRGLVAWWLVTHLRGGYRFLDLLGFNHCTLVANPPWSGHSRPSGYASLDCTAASVQYATISTGLGLTDFPVTLAAWVRLKTTATEQTILSLANTSYIQLSGHNTRGWEFTVRNGGGVFDTDAFSVCSGGTLDTNWHHLVGVAESSTLIRLYLDGVLLDTDTHTTTFPSLSKTVLGYEADTAPARPLNGYLDDCRVYSRLLNATDVRDLYNASRTGYQLELNRISTLSRCLPQVVAGGGGYVPYRNQMAGGLSQLSGGLAA